MNPVQIFRLKIQMKTQMKIQLEYSVEKLPLYLNIKLTKNVAEI